MSSDEIICKGTLKGQLSMNCQGGFVCVCYACVHVLYVCMCTCWYECTCVHVWMEARAWYRMSYCIMLSTFSLTQDLFSLNLDHTDSAILTGQRVPEIFLSGSASPLRNRSTCYCVWLFVCILGMDSGPHDCTENTLLPKPSSNPPLEDFW